MRFVMIVLFGILSIGCSTFSRKECASMNWNQIGFDLGYNGSPELQSQYNYYKNTCGEDHDIHPDKQSMENGYRAGLSQYCSAEGGLRSGAAGIRYANVCPQEKVADFMKTYSPARLSWLETDYARLKRENDRLSSENRQLESEISSLESQISSLRGEVSSLQSRTCP